MSILSKTMTVIETKLEHVEKDLARYAVWSTKETET